jgi:hypothetical protein
MLVMGGMIFLALVSLRFNSSLLENSTVEIENKVALTAFSLADDLIEEIKTRSFDAATVQFPTNDPTDLTPANALGPKMGEVYPFFNDIDDFHNYTRVASAPHAENYTVKCEVFYVDGNNPNNTSGIQTFYKKVVVTVISPYMRHSLSLSYIFTLK